MVRLGKSLRREVMFGERACTLAIDPLGLRLLEKGRRNEPVLALSDLASGDAAVATALQASLES
jgi:hypothetical protein